MRDSLRSITRVGAIFVSWLATVLISDVPAATQETVVLLFKDSVLVNDTLIKLSDIATIQKTPEHLRDSVANIRIGESAPAGYSRFASVDEIHAQLLRPRFRSVNFECRGPQRIRVVTDSRAVTIGDFADTLHSFVRYHLAWAPGDYEIVIENPTVSRRILNKPFSVQLSGSVNSYAKGPVRLTVQLVQGGRSSSVPVVCRIRVTVPVLVASAEIPRGAEFTQNNTTLRRIDITGFSFHPCTHLEDTKGRMALRTVSIGTIMHTGLLRDIPAVRKGDRLYLSSEKGPIKVSVLVVAREDGVAGQRIWVENLTTNKLLRVEVVNRETARLLPQEAI